MGIEYYVVDKKKKVFYELGKGGWYALADEPEALTDYEYLVIFILEDCFGLEREDDPKEYEKLEKYVEKRIALDLYMNFGSSDMKDIRILSDSGDDMLNILRKRYTCIGSRYGEKDSKEYLDSLKELNQHLKFEKPGYFV